MRVNNKRKHSHQMRANACIGTCLRKNCVCVLHVRRPLISHLYCTIMYFVLRWWQCSQQRNCSLATGCRCGCHVIIIYYYFVICDRLTRRNYQEGHCCQFLVMKTKLNLESWYTLPTQWKIQVNIVMRKITSYCQAKTKS